MSFKIAELFAEIRGDKKPLDATIDAAKRSLEGLVGHAARQGSRMAGALFSPIKGAADAAGALWKNALTLGTAGAAAGIGYAVKAASDLNEQVSKTNVVFGNAAREVLGSAEQMAREFGVVKTTFIEAAGGIGLIGKAAGLSQAEAAKLATRFTKLAADASSFYNIPLDDALVKIRAGLVGEAEPLRTLGVLLNEDAVKAEALRLGLARGNKELSEGQKVQARASLILRGMRDAQGDLARTADGLANRLRELQGRWVNLAADAGQHLIEPAKVLISALGDLARSMGDWVERNAARIRAWGDAFKDAVRWVVALAERRDALFKGLKENWAAAFKELFRTLAHNFGELARFFGQSLVKSISDALADSGLGKFLAAALNAGQPGLNLQLPRMAAPAPPQFRGADFRNMPGLGGVLAAAGADVAVARFRDQLRRATDDLGELGRRSKDVLNPLKNAVRNLVRPIVAVNAGGLDAARRKNADDVANAQRRKVEALADAQARKFLDFQRRNFGAMDPQLKKLWMNNPQAARAARDRMARIRKDDAERRKQARVLANPRNLKALFAGMGLAGQAAGGMMGAAGMAAAAMPAAMMGARFALAAMPKPEGRREARFEGLEEYYKNLQLGAFGGQDPNKETADNTKRAVDVLVAIKLVMDKIAVGGGFGGMVPGVAVGPGN